MFAQDFECVNLINKIVFIIRQMKLHTFTSHREHNYPITTTQAFGKMSRFESFFVTPLLLIRSLWVEVLLCGDQYRWMIVR